jgi:putative ABC transport system ATP-binding protein
MSKIRLENVCKHFYRERKRVEVFRDFNVVIESGQLTYIVGDAGSGKTTLVNLITGIERVNNGRIFVDTTELTALDDITSGHFRQEQFGILQRHSFRAGITVQETIEEALHSRSKKDVLTEAEQLLRRVNAYDHRHELATQLSNEG